MNDSTVDLNNPLLFRDAIVLTLKLSMNKDKRKRPVGWRTVRKWARNKGLPLKYDPAGRAVCVKEDLLEWVRNRDKNKKMKKR